MTPAAETLRQKFEDAVGRNDFEAFRNDYLESLSQFPAFQKAYSATPTDVTVHNAIFGRTCFFLKQTNDAQAKDLLQQGRAASKVFGTLSVAERLGFLKLLQNKIEKYSDEMELAISADTGKPLELSISEMKKGQEWFDFAAANAEAQIGPKGSADFRIAARPLGVAQIIGAYNYPYALAIPGIVGALTAGNSVIVSPPLKAPNWVFPFMKAAEEALDEFAGTAIKEEKPWAGDFVDYVDGLIQNSIGVNQFLTANADIVHFVGSERTGNIIAASRGSKPTILEKGGSNVVVVMKSALNKEGAVEKITQAIYGGFVPATGQRCTAPRILVPEEGTEDVVRTAGKLIAEGDHHIGNNFSKGTKMGPLVDRGARQKMDEAIALAHELGATVYGDIKVNSNIVPQALNENSYWVSPIMIDWSTVDLKDPAKAARVDTVLKDEIFGPLLHVTPRISGIDEAIAVTDKLNIYGLAGAIFSGDQEEIDKYYASVNVTSLSANEGPKDRSPKGPHGHPGLDTIGGDTHFRLYTRKGLLAQPELKVAP